MKYAVEIVAIILIAAIMIVFMSVVVSAYITMH